MTLPWVIKRHRRVGSRREVALGLTAALIKHPPIGPSQNTSAMECTPVALIRWGRPDAHSTMYSLGITRSVRNPTSSPACPSIRHDGSDTDTRPYEYACRSWLCVSHRTYSRIEMVDATCRHSWQRTQTWNQPSRNQRSLRVSTFGDRRCHASGSGCIASHIPVTTCVRCGCDRADTGHTS